MGVITGRGRQKSIYPEGSVFQKSIWVSTDAANTEYPFQQSGGDYLRATRTMLRVGRRVKCMGFWRFRGGLVCKAHRLCVSLNSRLESNEEGRHTRLGTRPATNTETLQPVFGIEPNLGFKATFGSTTILHAPTDAVWTAKGGRSRPKLRQEVVNDAPFKLNTWRRF